MRRLYHEATSEPIRLRDSNISREELKAEIRWREGRDERRYWAMFFLTLIGAFAAIVGRNRRLANALASALSVQP